MIIVPEKNICHLFHGELFYPDQTKLVFPHFFSVQASLITFQTIKIM